MAEFGHGASCTHQVRPVRGQVRDGIASFLGIPYAASPTGALRFAAPVPPEPRAYVLEATAFGPTPPKPAYPAPFDTLLEDREIAGDNWLNLNVWTPESRCRWPWRC